MKRVAYTLIALAGFWFGTEGLLLAIPAIMIYTGGFILGGADSERKN